MYRFIISYETENAIQQNEEGSLKRIKNEEGKDEDVLVVRGTYSYQDPSGQTINVVYFADETGFHAEGAHIPVDNAIPKIQPPIGLPKPPSGLTTPPSRPPSPPKPAPTYRPVSLFPHSPRFSP